MQSSAMTPCCARAMRPALWALCSLLFGLVCIDGSAVQAASFDCARVSPNQTTESAICTNHSLSELDDEVAVLYREASDELANRGEAFDGVRDDQRAWLRERGVCGADEGCIQSAYERRVAALQAVIDARAKVEVEAASEQPNPIAVPLAVRAAEPNEIGALETGAEPVNSIDPETDKDSTIQNQVEEVLP